MALEIVALEQAKNQALRGIIFRPEHFGAEGDGTTDDTAALQACIDAAAAKGGGLVLLSRKYGWTGDLIQKSRVSVLGASAVDYTVSGVYPQTGLVALSGTARYRYGRLGQPDVLGDTPGFLHGVVIDGAGVGGAGAELLRAECVEGSVRDVFVIRSAADGICLASAQNSIFDHVHVGIVGGDGWVLRENIAGVSQGCGGNKIRNCYTMQWTHRAVRVHVDSGAPFGPHDNLFDGCIFEAYLASFQNFVDADAGETVFRHCVFTFSNAAGVATDDCMVKVSAVAFPVFSTVATFDGCYFSGGTTAPPTDAIKAIGLQQVVLNGRTQVNGPAYIVGLEGGASRIVDDGWIALISPSTQFVRLGTGGGLSNSWRTMYTGRRFLMPPAAVAPIDLRQPGDTGSRLALGVTGAVALGDGAGASVTIDYWFAHLRLNNLLLLNCGVTNGVTTVTGATGTVAVTSATTPVYEIRCAANASVAINLVGNETGRRITLAILGNGSNTLSWVQTILWGKAGAPSAPADGLWRVVDLIFLNGSWVEESRNAPNISDGVWAANTVVTPNKLYKVPTGGMAYVTTVRTTGAVYDQTEEDAWTLVPGGHYKSVLAAGSGNFKCPNGITQARIRLKGGGGQGGGGGSSTTVNTAGGGAGGAGAALDAEVLALVAGTNYAYQVGTGGSGAGGGGTAGGAGTSGANGADTTFTGPAATYTAKGGGRGAGPGGNSAAVAGGGLIGFPAKSSTTSYLPGCGGPSAVGATPNAGVVGGAGGVAATTTTTNLGGNGGGARTAPGAAVGDPVGQTATANGGNGTTATENGCGGGGGGAGGNGGTGGTGGAGAPGSAEWWY